MCRFIYLEERMKLTKYYVTGYNPRFGNWSAQVYECATMENAKLRFSLEFPYLKTIKAYALRTD